MFSMVQNLSETVIVPIAGMILAFVMTLELIQLIIDKNNLNDVDTWMFFKWIFKTACAILIVTNTWNIVMVVFDVSQSVVNRAAGVIISDASIDITSVVTDMESRLMEMELGPLFGLWFQSLFVGITMWAQPGMGADGPELSPLPVRPGLSGVSHYYLCGHLCGAGAEYRNGKRYYRRDLVVRGLYGAFVLHPL